MEIKLVLKNDASNSAERTHSFDELLITIGNSPAATIFINDRRVAPEQAVIVNENEEPVFISQAKGTIYNGREIEQGARREVESGDRIQIGSYSLTVLPDSPSGSLQVSETAAAAGAAPRGNFAVAEQTNGNGAANLDYANENLSQQSDIRSFADILNSLRKEEDQFYFQFVGENAQSNERVPIDSQEVFLGWNMEKGVFTTGRENITEPQAVVRKDWSGVTIYPQGKEAILINNSLLEAGKRLKNGDNLIFKRKLSPATNEEVTLVFCEPAALVELNSILPDQLLNTALGTIMTPEAQRRRRLQFDEISENDSAAVAISATAAQNNPRYFGYFTAIETLIMVFATILTAALTYLLLEFS
jgi:hypothetical protein